MTRPMPNVQRYRKRPVVIEAIQYTGWDVAGACETFLGDSFETHLLNPYRIVINTLEGEMTCSLGDWIIRGVEGEHYPCKASVFEATYEAIA